MTAHIPIIPSSEITPRELFYNRRHFLQLAADATLASLLPHSVLAGEQLANVRKATESLSDELTTLKDITSYNNFYEFGTGKEDPAQNVGSLKTRPWSITVEGEVNKSIVFDIEELLKLAPLEERVYRLRCVEAWFKVIPWVGYRWLNYLNA